MLGIYAYDGSVMLSRDTSRKSSQGGKDSKNGIRPARCQRGFLRVPKTLYISKLIWSQSLLILGHAAAKIDHKARGADG